MTDTIETIGRSVIQHGPNSRRVYLMKLDPADLPELHDVIPRLIKRYAYGKVFAKVPATAMDSFLERGYREEARIPGYYLGRTDAVLLGYYHDVERAVDYDAETNAAVLKSALEQSPRPPPVLGSRSLRRLTPDDIPDLASLYRAIFASYPFPITSPDYLSHTMAAHVVYFGIFDGRQLAAASSAEMDTEASAAEMTDFATASAFQGQGLALTLLAGMDASMQRQGIRTAYTIARSNSHGMNITFARGGYSFGGTLINNTGIGGAIESMNVWFKSLAVS